MYENMSGIAIKGKCFDETKKMVFHFMRSLV